MKSSPFKRRPHILPAGAVKGHKLVEKAEAGTLPFSLVGIVLES